MAQTFEQYVCTWLATQHPGVNQVTGVTADGSDWAGSTEAGFYETFTVTIEWLDASGGAHYTDIRGTWLESLWRHVVGGFQRG